MKLAVDTCRWTISNEGGNSLDEWTDSNTAKKCAPPCAKSMTCVNVCAVSGGLRFTALDRSTRCGRTVLASTNHHLSPTAQATRFSRRDAFVRHGSLTKATIAGTVAGRTHELAKARASRSHQRAHAPDLRYATGHAGDLEDHIAEVGLRRRDAAVVIKGTAARDLRRQVARHYSLVARANAHRLASAAVEGTATRPTGPRAVTDMVREFDCPLCTQEAHRRPERLGGAFLSARARNPACREPRSAVTRGARPHYNSSKATATGHGPLAATVWHRE